MILSDGSNDGIITGELLDPLSENDIGRITMSAISPVLYYPQ